MRILLAGATSYADVVVDSFEVLENIEIVGILNNRLDRLPSDQPTLRPVFWDGETDQLPEGCKVVCVLATTKRRAWITDLQDRGFEFTSLVHPASVISERSQVGAGSTVDTGTIIAGFSRIHTHVRIGRGTCIGHHSEVGEFSTIHPRCVISGHVHIGEQVMIGTGAIIIDRVKIGAGAVISAGSVVTRNVPAGGLVRGNPGRVVKEGYGPV